MNEGRTKVLALVAGGAFLLFVGEKAYVSLWSDPWAKVNREIEDAKLELARAKAVVARESEVREDWKKIRGLLDKRPANVGTHLVSHLDSIFDRVGTRADISSTSVQQQQGDFREYVFETRFKLPWGPFVDLLAELHNSREFLKLLRLNVASQYEREDRLDVDLKVSTIEYAPPPAKGK
jgi:hypothetical protein